MRRRIVEMWYQLISLSKRTKLTGEGICGFVPEKNKFSSLNLRWKLIRHGNRETFPLRFSRDVAHTKRREGKKIPPVHFLRNKARDEAYCKNHITPAKKSPCSSFAGQNRKLAHTRSEDTPPPGRGRCSTRRKMLLQRCSLPISLDKRGRGKVSEQKTEAPDLSLRSHEIEMRYRLP
ncbi:hypothetical protein TNCV_3131151 [Trichonephila clavipes]|nr:hypothetical protein TNCV_3131151 [Trichonephila clavipes]